MITQLSVGLFFPPRNMRMSVQKLFKADQRRTTTFSKKRRVLFLVNRLLNMESAPESIA